MATQLAEEPQAESSQVENDNAPRDYEAEARAHGWIPPEEFKGDPSRHIDAEAFVKRADEFMPLLKKQNEGMRREIADLKKSVAKASEHFSKAEERAYERAMSDITARMEQAVETGDVEAHRAAQKDLTALGKDVRAESPAVDPLDVQEALIDFRDANPWYDEKGVARDYADVVAEKFKAKTADMAPADFFAFVAEKVRERYPDLDKPKAERRKPGSMVEAPTARGAPRGRSFNDLPQLAQQMADKWIRQGLIKDRAAYVSTYQWDDKR